MVGWVIRMSTIWPEESLDPRVKRGRGQL